jgi:preprotein translocase subunit Sec61beta
MTNNSHFNHWEYKHPNLSALVVVGAALAIIVLVVYLHMKGACS